MGYNRTDFATLLRETDLKLGEEQIDAIAKAISSKVAGQFNAQKSMAEADVRRSTAEATEAAWRDRNAARDIRRDAEREMERARQMLAEAHALQAKTRVAADHATVLAAAVAEDPRIGLADYHIRDAWRRADAGEVDPDQACRTTGMIVASMLGGLDTEALARAAKKVKGERAKKSAPTEAKKSNESPRAAAFAKLSGVIIEKSTQPDPKNNGATSAATQHAAAFAELNRLAESSTSTETPANPHARAVARFNGALPEPEMLKKKKVVMEALGMDEETFDKMMCDFEGGKKMAPHDPKKNGADAAPERPSAATFFNRTAPR